ncbi:MAG TPA: YetF domain-containing protein [Fimbriimonadales bacterium]|jgi:uncharacterized membrane protein YcaP (DUF421 family)|nr:YetF domain-containing protein [Fimbriimonadales bacterium]
MDSLEKIFSAQGSDLGPLLVVPRTVIVFLVAVVYVRWAKKRFIAQASAIDLVLAVIFGSLLSRAINGGATLASSLVSGLTVVVLHRIILHYSARSPRLFDIVKGHRETIVRDGTFQRPQMRKHDVSEEDVLQELRLRALTDDLGAVREAVLERSGQISIVKQR